MMAENILDDTYPENT